MGEGFAAETGLSFSFIVALDQDGTGGAPDGETSLLYASQVGISSIPVTSDPLQRLTLATPWTGISRPGKCALAPEMTILHCWEGDDNAPGFDAIRMHAGIAP